jgi:L-2-hydroxyglutarate oxidase LhgO
MRVVVVGAGIIGTTTAYRLKRRYPDLDLQIVAERLSPHTTSDICRL